MNARKANKATSNVPKGKKTLLNKLKNLLGSLLGLGIVLLLFWGVMMWSRWYERGEISEIKKSNTSTIGTIVKVGSMKGSYAIAEYFVDGRRYEKKNSSPAEDIYTGEHYVVFYKGTAPNIAFIDFASPVFLEGEQTGATIATIVYKDWAKVGFAYTVDGQDIKRFQRCSEGVELHEGQTLPVEYLVKNPRVGILKIK